MQVLIDGVPYAPCPQVPSDGRSFADLITDIRKVLGWTYEEAATRIGCTWRELYALENGIKKRGIGPSFKTAALISRAYGLPLEILAAAILTKD